MKHLAVLLAAAVGMAGLARTQDTTAGRFGQPVNGISIGLETDKRSYEPGEPIKVKIIFRNHTDAAIRIWQSGYLQPQSRWTPWTGPPRYHWVPGQSVRLLIDGQAREGVPIPAFEIPAKGRHAIWLTIGARQQLLPGPAPGKHTLHLKATYSGLYYSWVGRAASNLVNFTTAADRPATKPAPTTQPAFDLDAAHKLLSKVVGGTWKKVRHSRRVGGHMLRGTLRAEPGHASRAEFVVLAFPLASPELLGSVNPFAHSAAPPRVLWGNDACTVLAYGDPPTQGETEIIQALSLGPPGKAPPAMQGAKRPKAKATGQGSAR